MTRGEGGAAWHRHTGTQGGLIIFNCYKDNVSWTLFHFVKRILQRKQQSVFGDYRELLI